MCGVFLEKNVVKGYLVETYRIVEIRYIKRGTYMYSRTLIDDFFITTLGTRNRLKQMTENELYSLIQSHSTYAQLCRTSFIKCTPKGILLKQNLNRKYCNVQFKLPFQRTKEQEAIAQKLCECSKVYSKILLQAICGAGKTEIVLDVIQQFINDGKRVAFIVPRKDLVEDVYEKYTSYFQGYPIGCKTGTSNRIYTHEIISCFTTHQAHRMYDVFDLILFDEVDAFPYEGNKELEESVERLGRKNACFIFMSATSTMKNIDYTIHMPIRFHGYPHPKVHIGPFCTSLEMSVFYFLKKVEIFLRREKERQDVLPSEEESLPVILFFVQSRKKAADLAQFINQVFEAEHVSDAQHNGKEQYDVRSYYSGIDLGELKNPRFLKESCSILCSTSILERGFTFPNTHVCVLEADAKMMDEKTLVQMVGRSGRTKKYPFGCVYLMPEKKITRAMYQAVKNIQEANRSLYK